MWQRAAIPNERLIVGSSDVITKAVLTWWKLVRFYVTFFGIMKRKVMRRHQEAYNRCLWILRNGILIHNSGSWKFLLQPAKKYTRLYRIHKIKDIYRVFLSPSGDLGIGLV